MKSEIEITNASADVTTIDIEGIIGTPEEWQFENEEAKVATYEEFKRAIERISNIKSKEIVVNIRSTGGNVNDALLIYDTLRSLPAKITTRCWGYVASAATIIAQGASQGRREISSNALYLIHKSVSSAQGNENDLSQTMQLLNKTDQRIASIYADRSGKSTDIYIEMMNENSGNGRWLTAEEAKEASLVDKVIKAAPIANDAGDMIEILGLPRLPENKSKSKTMTLAEKWSAIRQIILQNDSTPAAVTTNAADDPQQITNKHQQQIEELQNRIEELEAQNAKLKAQPTKTKAKEDPSVSDTKRSVNEEAYFADAKRFK